MANCILRKNCVQKGVRNMVPHCERMFHVEQGAGCSGGECSRHFAMFHVEHLTSGRAVFKDRALLRSTWNTHGFCLAGLADPDARCGTRFGNSPLQVRRADKEY